MLSVTTQKIIINVAIHMIALDFSSKNVRSLGEVEIQMGTVGVQFVV